MRSLTTIRNFVLGAALAVAPMAAHAGIFISVGFAPPVLPVYTQPLCPGDGYLWTPGYWAYGPEGYYWIPGVWVEPPTVGYLWTPPYWGFEGGNYRFHDGYWGNQVGFYGGVNYGFGFFGSGYYGGRWEGNRFAYNRSVNNINITNIHNTYEDRTVFNRVNVNNRTSFNGGPNGIQARPDSREAAFSNQRHEGPTTNQQRNFESARNDRGNFATANGGHPQVAAMPRVGDTQGAVQSRGFAGRADNQQQRIGQGVNSGQITARGASNLENREANINQQARQDRQANGGALNQQQRENLNQRQNNVGNSIYQDKHNAATQPTVRNGFGGNQQQGQLQQRQQQQQQQQVRQQQPQQQQPQQFHQQPQVQQHSSPAAQPHAEGPRGGGEGGGHRPR